MPVLVAEPLVMSDEQRVALVRMARSSSLPHRQVVQAKALLLAADGVATNDVARRCGTTDTSVRKWRHRFAEQGVDGVGRIAPGRGRKSWLPEGRSRRWSPTRCTASPTTARPIQRHG